MTSDHHQIRRLATRFGVEHLEPVVVRFGRCVFKGMQGGDTVYLKLSVDKRPFEREVEILQALNGASDIAPRLLAAQAFDGWFVQVSRELPGRTLDEVLPTATQSDRFKLVASAGQLLATFHQCVNEDGIRQLSSLRDSSLANRALPLWKDHLHGLMNKWVSRLRFTDDDRSLQIDKTIEAVSRMTAWVPEPPSKTILHCDYVGRNIIVGPQYQAVGLLDFEAAQMGDPAYDAAKFVWATLDWRRQDEASVFVRAWSHAYGYRLDQTLFHIYVAAQTVAAIAWCDKNSDHGADHSAFRARASSALVAVARELPCP